jgi:hypothetical protein
VADLAPFPDIEDALIEALADFGEVDSVFPADLADRVAGDQVFVRVQRISGGAGRISDGPLVDVDVAAATRAVAMAAALRIEQRLTSGPVRTSKGVVDRGRCETGPRRLAAEDEHIRHVVATYRLSTRRLSTTVQ